MAALDIVIFGGSGDLSLRKLMPALYFLQRRGRLPAGSRILAVARERLDPAAFRARVLDKLAFYLGADFSADKARAFVGRLDYLALDIGPHSPDVSGDVSAWTRLADYLDLASGRTVIYYLAVAPTLFGPVCAQIRAHGLNPDRSRLVVEKPLGEDMANAAALNKVLSAGFGEDQIYRIDHYLGKAAIQNLLALRFGNRLIDAVWSRDHIDNIQITVAETVGVEGRGEFLDRVGILRDMAQNHLMQILSCLAMETPLSLAADDIRDEKLRVVRALRPVTADNVRDHVVRAQYGPGGGMAGYREELAASFAAADGGGETFVALKAMVDNDRWHGVPFYLRTGKRLKKRFAEIVIQFKPAPGNIFNAPAHNRIVIGLQPDMAVGFDIFMQRIRGDDGRGLILSRHGMDPAAGAGGRIADAYEKLLGDVMRGDQSYFVRQDEILASWKWIDGIRKAWKEKDLNMETYAAGSMGPAASDALLAAAGHRWHEE